MKNKAGYGFKRALLSCMLVIVFALPWHASSQQLPPGQFPFFKSFLDGEMSYVERPTPNAPTQYVIPFDPWNTRTVNRANQATPVNGLGLKLTESVNQVGAFYLPYHTFSTEDGMLIEFEYMMYGNENAITDGICMYLIDASTITGGPLYGAEGAGFGYTYNYSASSVNRIRGMHGGYLAVALDNGPFKTARFEGGELRNGALYRAVGSPARLVENTLPTAHDTQSNVTIRGAAGPNARQIVVEGTNINGNKFRTSYDMQAGYWGYPMLAYRHTGGASDSKGLRNQVSYRLNNVDGYFEQDNTSPDIDAPFDIASKKIFLNSEDPAYRKAIIALEPNPDTQEGGFRITVAIQHGKTKTVVIQNFTYPALIRYRENGLPLTYTTHSQNGITLFDLTANTKNVPLVEYTVPAPERLVIGFAASTGLVTPYTNVIKNLRITTLYAAESEEDIFDNHRRGPATIKILENDKAWQKVGSDMELDQAHIDPTTVRLWASETARSAVGDYECEVPGQGKWIYDPTTEELIFFPVKGFTGTAKIMYDVKGKAPEYDNEKYRSSLATVMVTIGDNQPS